MDRPDSTHGNGSNDSTGTASSRVREGPWNPGIESAIPEALRPLCTFLRPENVFTTVAKASEMRDLTGLAWIDVVAFRPQRLALHELLVRVTARVSVPDGSKIEDLGINFREITRRILARHVEPRMGEIESAWSVARLRVADFVRRELDSAFAAGSGTAWEASRPAGVERTRSFTPEWLLGWFAGRRTPPQRQAERTPHTQIDRKRATPLSAFDALTQWIAQWEASARLAAPGVEKTASRALAKVVAAVLVRHGAIWGSRELIESLAVDVGCNDLASDEVGRLIEAWLPDAAPAEGYVLLPRQLRPVIMNTKGPSASGKSTLRPLQRKLAGDIGVDWSEFALISPDIWRKQLIDYAGLGSAYKYGGAFTGDELHIVDQKLDRYMARSAAVGEVPHLLIDRFRFDSFAPDSSEAGSNLLTRFGQVVYLFLMIAPPEMLVERAWTRGLEVGRYKAVDDTLAHAVEAYSGMPDLFFTWIDRRDKDVHFEFLDNSVAIGERPRTAAFGHNRRLNVLDLQCLIDIERFCRIDIGATAPDRLYADTRMLAAEHNVSFVVRCVNRFPEVNFAEPSTGQVFVHVVSGRVDWVDRGALDRACSDPDLHAALLAAVPGLRSERLPGAPSTVFLGSGADATEFSTLGEWGSDPR